MSPYIIVLFLLCATNVKAADTFTEWMLDMIYYIEYHVYSRDKPCTPDVLTYRDDIALNKSTYKRRNGTVLYIHGWSDSNNNAHAQEIRNAYLQSMDYNIILVDWSTISSSSYFFVSAPSVAIAGRQIAKMMRWLEAHNRLNISELHIIGKSLGAQVSGFVGKSLKPQQVRRITGLDPALPLFEGENSQNRLDKSDANFVDIIHTSYLGIISPYGHADFYANYGENHPGCYMMDISCYHGRAVTYFIESISNPHKYAAYKCQYDNNRLQNCAQNTTNSFMGHFADPQMHGTFLVIIT